MLVKELTYLDMRKTLGVFHREQSGRAPGYLVVDCRRQHWGFAHELHPDSFVASSV
jgi:hypothetical protein